MQRHFTNGIRHQNWLIFGQDIYGRVKMTAEIRKLNNFNINTLSGVHLIIRNLFQSSSAKLQFSHYFSSIFSIRYIFDYLIAI